MSLYTHTGQIILCSLALRSSTNMKGSEAIEEISALTATV